MRHLARAFLVCTSFALSLLPRPASAQSREYNPLFLPERAINYLDDEIKSASRDRVIPVRIYLPCGKGTAPVLLFSHGLGGSREENSYLGEHWSQRGFVVVFLQHPGSDSSLHRSRDFCYTPRSTNF